MDPERWQNVKAIVAGALELSPERRVAWLSSVLPDDPGLAAEVEGLLAADLASVDELFERGALAAVPEVRQQLEGVVEGVRIGPYRVLSELGRGGMGAVYLAVRDQAGGGFTQKVAIKLIKRGMDTDEIVRRFVAERQILASFAHPNIARLFDGGSTPDGRPYFVMEYVEGRPINVYAAEERLSIEARLRLFLKVCRAVQNAHQSLVVHRDLKPANILVDAEGEPKLLDFGIAKLLNPRSFGELTALTGLAPGPMTPDYASPEQRAGGPVTTATDVYGLGLLLYELLVGQAPRSVESRLGAGWGHRPPSQALAALGGEQGRRTARRVSGDLDTIVGKALESEPERRYGTAAALARDVELHLDQRPVAARRPTLAYRMGRSLVRHKLAALLVLGGSLIAILYFVQVDRARAQAEAQYRRAQALNELFQSVMKRASPEESRGETVTVRQVLDAGGKELLSRDAGKDAETLAALHEAVGDTYSSLGLYDDARTFLERALRLREGLPHPSREAGLDIAGNWSLLGQVALQQKRYADCRAAYRRAIALKESLLGDADALPLAGDWNGLGLVAVGEGRWDDAERFFGKALAIGRRAAGEGGGELVAAYNNLGYLAASKGEPARAQVYFAAALRYYRRTVGDDHPSAVLARSNLAYALYSRGDFAAAEALYREIAEARLRLLGPAHPDSARALLNLAVLQHQRGRLAAARATLDRFLAIRRAHRFPVDQDEAESLNLLGQTYLGEQQLEAAGAALARSFEIYRSLPGEHRPDLANVLRGQALVRRSRGDLAGAMALARRSFELRRAALGEAHFSLAAPLELIADLSLQAGRAEEAEARYRQILSLLAGPDWAGHATRARVSRNLGSLLVAGGRPREAQRYLDEARRIEVQLRNRAGAASPGPS